MSRCHRSFVAASIVLLGILAARGAHAQSGAAAPAAPSGVRADMLTWIHDARDKIIQLAEATPEAKYKYRPGKGVRTTGEVFMHVVTANYGIPMGLGVKPPEGFSRDYEKSLTKKDDIVKALKDSFAHVDKAFEGTPDADMDKPVELFGGYVKTSVRGAYMLLLAHAHEHLGQSIAYARGNGITPPWSK
jgi:uncharacterized damage-inducible protein DinB